MSTKYLSHHGIIGQKWGVRRFQNQDGSLTSAGRKRYIGKLEGDIKASKAGRKAYKTAKKEGYSLNNSHRLAKAATYDSMAESRKHNLDVRNKNTKNTDGKLTTTKQQMEKEANMKRENTINRLHSRADTIRDNVEIRESKRQAKLYNKDLNKKQGDLIVDALNKSTNGDKSYDYYINKNVEGFQKNNEHYQWLKERGHIETDTPTKKSNYGSSDTVIDATYKELPSKKMYTREQSNAIASDADKLVTGSNSIRKSVSKSRDLSKYSDAELQKIVNRQQLEQRYNQLNPDKVDQGASILRESIQTAGAAAGLYASYKIIKNL